MECGSISDDEVLQMAQSILEPSMDISDTVAFQALNASTQRVMTLLDNSIRNLDACTITPIPPDCDQIDSIEYHSYNCFVGTETVPSTGMETS